VSKTQSLTDQRKPKEDLDMEFNEQRRKELLATLEHFTFPVTMARKLKGVGIKFCMKCRKHVELEHNHKKGASK
jgi:hypothetical protein